MLILLKNCSKPKTSKLTLRTRYLCHIKNRFIKANYLIFMILFFVERQLSSDVGVWERRDSNNATAVATTGCIHIYSLLHYQDGETALVLALAGSGGKDTLVRLLLDRGADPNSADKVSTINYIAWATVYP